MPDEKIQDLFAFVNLFEIVTSFVNNRFEELVNHFLTKVSQVWSFLCADFLHSPFVQESKIYEPIS